MDNMQFHPNEEGHGIAQDQAILFASLTPDHVVCIYMPYVPALQARGSRTSRLGGGEEKGVLQSHKSKTTPRAHD